ncbi:MAG: hypothetical protein K2X99_08050 [Gemmatimonadaceae bacterium]|nr:hypothetical protein [Gemmatimonadaceae bacterium]
MRHRHLWLGLLPALLCAQQPIDSAYTAKIRELTPTDPVHKFTTELVDHLPASPTVPTPLAVLGFVPGTVGRLGYSHEIYKYFRTVDEKSPRVQVWSIGKTDLGKEMIVAAVADSETIARLDDYKKLTARMADPRGMSAEEKAKLLREAKPIYAITGSIHSPETGSPDMTMELLYRLAVDESPYYQAIRKNMIVMITPIFEVDGRDHMVDWYNQQKALKLPAGAAGGLPYWGKYVAHDNNRDGMVVSQQLTKNFLRNFLEWHPTITHDLHESVPFLHTSTGTGPYNEEFDPIVIDEWHVLAYQEITELTRRGLPGVWTHSFYDGWAPNYQLAIANLHNSVGRFYETYTSSGADCQTVRLGAQQTSRTWDRPSPPVNGVRWCIRSNHNYQQSALLVAIKYVADHRETFVANNIAKGERMIARGVNGPLRAFVIPRGQRHAAEAADLVNLFRTQGTEVHEATADFSVTSDVGGALDVKVGDWIVRLDQPYSGFPRTVLAIQRFKPEDPNPYDDTGWTLDELRHVRTLKVGDAAIFAKPMKPLAADAKVDGAVRGAGATLVVRHVGDWRSAMFPWKAAPAKLRVADSAFTVGEARFPAGTWIVADAPKVREAITLLGLEATATPTVSVAAHDVTLPRVALAHSWLSTQDEGWIRYTFDVLGVPYTYLSDQGFKNPGALDRFDVIVYPHVGGQFNTLLNGRLKAGPPIPWKKSKETPNLGDIDATDDVRDGMTLAGALALRQFVERGGTLIIEGNSVQLPINLEFTTGVQLAQPRALQARGAVFRSQVADAASPILYGYEPRGFPIFFSQSPLLQTGGGGFGGGGGGGAAAPDPVIAAAQRAVQARTVLRFHTNADSLLISGQLNGGAELAGKAAVVDAPVGKGHIVLFATRPFWRWQTQGAFAMALNAMVHWNALSGVPVAPMAPARATTR